MSIIESRLRILHGKPSKNLLYEAFDIGKSPKVPENESRHFVPFSYKKHDTVFHEVLNENKEVISLRFHNVSSTPPPLDEFGSYKNLCAIDVYCRINFNWLFKLLHQISEKNKCKMILRLYDDAMVSPTPLSTDTDMSFNFNPEEHSCKLLKEMKISYDYKYYNNPNNKEGASNIRLNFMRIFQIGPKFMPNLNKLNMYMPMDKKLENVMEEFFEFFEGIWKNGDIRKRNAYNLLIFKPDIDKERQTNLRRSSTSQAETELIDILTTDEESDGEEEVVTSSPSINQSPRQETKMFSASGPTTISVTQSPPVARNHSSTLQQQQGNTDPRKKPRIAESPGTSQQGQEKQTKQVQFQSSSSSSPTQLMPSRISPRKRHLSTDSDKTVVLSRDNSGSGKQAAKKSSLKKN